MLAYPTTFLKETLRDLDYFPPKVKQAFLGPESGN